MNHIHTVDVHSRSSRDNVRGAARDYDVVVDLQNTLRSRSLLRSVRGTVLRVNKRTFRRAVLVRFKIDLLRDQPDVIGRYIETIASLGITDKGKASRLLSRASAPEGLRVAICPGSKHWNKRWPIEYVVEVCRDLLEHGAIIELYGADADRAECEQIKQAIPEAHNFCGSLTLGELVDHIAGCKLAITNDSGLMHVASTVGTPTVAVFGPTVRQFGFVPRQQSTHVAENPGLYCRPCTPYGLDHCPEKHFRCMREIAPSAVLSQALQLVDLK